jgi:phosphate transport system permease protein
VQTMTAYIAGRSTGDISQGTVVYDSIFAVGSLLFLMTLAMNMLAVRFVRRFREVYE